MQGRRGAGGRGLPPSPEGVRGWQGRGSPVLGGEDPPWPARAGTAAQGPRGPGRAGEGWGRGGERGLFLVGVPCGTHLAGRKVIYEVKVSNNEATSWRPGPALRVLLGALLRKINCNPTIKTKSEKHICPCGQERAALLPEVPRPGGPVLWRETRSLRDCDTGWGSAVRGGGAPGHRPLPQRPAPLPGPLPAAPPPPHPPPCAWGLLPPQCNSELPSTPGEGSQGGPGWGISEPANLGGAPGPRLSRGGWRPASRDRGGSGGGVQRPGPPFLGLPCGQDFPEQVCPTFSGEGSARGRRWSKGGGGRGGENGKEGAREGGRPAFVRPP